jgi:hypothetical protein
MKPEGFSMQESEARLEDDSAIEETEPFVIEIRMLDKIETIENKSMSR